MNTVRNKSKLTTWTPLRQWIVPLCILLAALFFKATGSNPTLPYYSVYVSLLMLAFMQVVLNAFRPNMLKNVGFSLLIFAAHAVLCFFSFRLLSDSPAFNSRLFAAILVFYVMATMLSALYRGILKLLAEAN